MSIFKVIREHPETWGDYDIIVAHYMDGKHAFTLEDTIMHVPQQTITFQRTYEIGQVSFNGVIGCVKNNMIFYRIPDVVVPEIEKMIIDPKFDPNKIKDPYFKAIIDYVMRKNVE